MKLSDQARMSVLLVDDERSIRLPLRLALERHGYRVLEADSGRVGIDLVRAHQGAIGVAVIDYHMPRMSGAEMIRELQRLPFCPALIVMSGMSREDLAETDVGAATYLRKPFELAHFIGTVDRLGPGPSADD